MPSRRPSSARHVGSAHDRVFIAAGTDDQYRVHNRFNRE